MKDLMRHFNRLKAKEPKRTQQWCGCDRQIVELGQKCKVCGVRFIKVKQRFKY